MRLKRWEVVLKYIVEDYIDSAIPVGSNQLLKNHKLQYSSATIRNEMAALEELGYIEKTHTSSGRVPSNDGYRYYVSNLRSDKIDKTIRYEIDRLVDSATSVEDLLFSSCEMLSNMTNLACCYLGPNVFDERIVKVESIKLTANKFTFIFITDRGYIENKTFVVKSDKLPKIIECTKEISSRIAGSRLINIFDKLKQVKEDLKEYKEEFEYISKIFVGILKDFIVKRNSEFYGKEYLLDQPEFKNSVENTRFIVNVLNHPYKLNRMFQDSDETMISIGNGDLKDVTIITKTIKIPGSLEDYGKIAVVGPTRMNYDKVLKYLDYVIEMVSYHISGLERNNYGRK